MNQNEPKNQIQTKQHGKLLDESQLLYIFLYLNKTTKKKNRH